MDSERECITDCVSAGQRASKVPVTPEFLVMKGAFPPTESDTPWVTCDCFWVPTARSIGSFPATFRCKALEIIRFDPHLQKK